MFVKIIVSILVSAVLPKQPFLTPPAILFMNMPVLNRNQDYDSCFYIRIDDNIIVY